jgi:hypothetical protein
MRRLLFALPALALLSSCGLFTAEVEVPSVTMTLVGFAFPSSPSGSLVQDFNFDLGGKIGAINDPNYGFELRLLGMSVDLQANPSMGDFGDIQSVSLSVLPPAGQTLPEATVLASYTRAPSNPHPTRITVSGMSNLDLRPYLSAGSLRLRFQAVSASGGIIPAWTGDVGAEFYLKVHADYGNLVKK